MSPAKRLFAAAILFSIFANLLILTGPLFMLQVYDRVLSSRSEETLVALFGLVAVLFLFYGMLEYARGRVMARVGARVEHALCPRVFNASMERSALGSGKGATAPVQHLDAVRALFTSPVLLALLDLPWTPIFIAAIFIFHPLLGWLAVAGGAVLITVAVLNQVLTSRKVRDAQKLSAASQDLARQAHDGAGLARVQGMSDALRQRWLKVRIEALGRSTRSNDWTGSFTSFSKAFRFFIQSAMLALGAWLVLKQQITAGAMIAASILLGRALAPVEQSVAQWPVVQRGRSGLRALRELLEEYPETPTRTELPPPTAQLDVQGVTVLVPGTDTPILRNLSFQLRPGEALGVIGRSGTGKTTLANVLVGLVEPTRGDVRLAGATPEQYGPERLGHYIGYLPQDVYLFDGTVAENIAQMGLAQDGDRIVAAAKKARLHETILNLPDGYDTRIGTDDTRLSGGQKQRLALARAVYGDPVLLVLDEPNSALDAEGSEALNALVKDMKAAGNGVVIMTHRPTAISACDTLLVMDRGRRVGYGPRDDIIKSLMQNAGDIQRAVGQDIGQ